MSGSSPNQSRVCVRLSVLSFKDLIIIFIRLFGLPDRHLLRHPETKKTPRSLPVSDPLTVRHTEEVCWSFKLSADSYNHSRVGDECMNAIYCEYATGNNWRRWKVEDG